MGIYVGTGGWVFEPWRGNFYPKGLPHKLELTYAASHLTGIEINSTFYGSPGPQSFRRWHDETPDRFVFALKGPRFATNRRILADAGNSVLRFFASGVTELKQKMGPVNWQFAPTKVFDAIDFEAFLKLLPKSVDGLTVRHSVEVRHESFKNEAFVKLCRRYNVAIVIGADGNFPVIADITADLIYIRAMGTQDNEELGYSESAIVNWAKRVRDWEKGEAPKDLPLLLPSARRQRRNVFLFVISGAKHKNAAAAQAIIAALL